MATKQRGRHQSTDKEGKRTIAAIEAISGVEAVFINRSIGGKSVGRSGRAGDFKSVSYTHLTLPTILLV